MVFTSSNSSSDLYLSLHYVGMLMAAEKIYGVWNIYIWMYDTYDFAYSNYSGYVTADFVSLINNYVALSQQMGAIVPYSINIYTREYY